MANEPDKAVTISSPYSVWETYAYGEIDPVGAPIIGDYDDPDVGFFHSARAARQKAATPDIFAHQQFTRGLVLAVLSGPTANNSATTGGRLTKLLSTRGTRPWWEELTIFQGKPPPLRAIVKVFALTPDLPMPKSWPPSARDEQIIALYPEYVALDPEICGDIRPGTMVRLQHDKAYKNNAGPLPVGTIVGVLGNRPADVKELRVSPKAGYSPKCVSPLKLNGPSGGNYVSHTVALIDPGRLVGKVKNKISLGVFGEGSVQTKAHFAACLQASAASMVKNIKGPAPNIKNAFIWVGHMKNNGYMDYIDRPPDLGRETIIYAPKYLDTGSDIELKYYFHDRAGFGMPWVNGPGTQVDQAIGNAAVEGNDFKDIVAPAIKDLMASGRNFILVIPEMMHSRGYGTKKGDASRINKLKTGKGVEIGSVVPYDGSIQRVSIDDQNNIDAMKAMKDLVDGYSTQFNLSAAGAEPMAVTQRLSAVNRWKERVYSTFDNSYTGGSFPSFHGEVKAVVEKYLGAQAKENINYISITAAGASVATLASMAAYGADNPFLVPINRVDLVTDVADDALQRSLPLANIHAVGEPPPFPAVLFYEEMVKVSAQNSQELEFNYFTSYNPFKAQSDAFFSGLGFGGNKFNTYYKPSNQNAGRVFTYFNPKDNPNAQIRNYTSLYLGEKPTLMSLTSTNDFIDPPQGPGVPSLEDLRINRPPRVRPSLPRILNGEVPDHAAGIANKPSNSRLLQLQVKEEELISKTQFFSNFLVVLKGSGQDSICLKDDYQMFCTGANTSDNNLLTLNASADSFLHSSYNTWYSDMKELRKTKILLYDETWMLWVENQPKSLALEAITNSLIEINARLPKLQSPEERKNKKDVDDSYGVFKLSEWSGPTAVEISNLEELLGNFSPSTDPRILNMISGYVEGGVLKDRKKYLEELKERFEAITTDLANVATPADCPSPPRALGIFAGSRKVNGAFSSGVVQCGSLRIPASAPENYSQLARILPYYPTKSEVSSENLDSNLKNEGWFQLAGIKHLTRRAGNKISYMNSAEYGTKVWECLAQKIQSSWESACAASRYVPFRIFAGYRKEKTPNISEGISLHDLGLAIDIDPSLNGNDPDWTRGVFTNAWHTRTVEHKDIDVLGVYSESSEDLIDNVYESGGFLWLGRGDAFLRSEDYDDAFGVYKEDLGTYLTTAHKNNIICPINSNPLLWVLVFCESSGMRWGNGTFMRKRYRGGKSWSPTEKLKLDRIFNISNVVDRVRAISWDTKDINDHMHFQYWGGKSFITFEEIEEAAKLNGVEYGL